MMSDTAAELHDDAQQHLVSAVILSERGLAAALESLIARSPVPADLRAPHERLAPAAEAAIYFTVAEALTNVAKHGQATMASVRVNVQNGLISARVLDDGVGGANADAGSGLRGLSDRLEALGGSLAIISPSGAGTIIRATLPARISAIAS